MASSIRPTRAAHAGGRTRELIDLDRHQPVAGKRQELADQIMIGALLGSSSAILSSVIVVISGAVQVRQPSPYRRPAVTASPAAPLPPTP